MEKKVSDISRETPKRKIQESALLLKQLSELWAEKRKAQSESSQSGYVQLAREPDDLERIIKERQDKVNLKEVKYEPQKVNMYQNNAPARQHYIQR